MKISERAAELYQTGQETDFYGYKHREISPSDALAKALDEWQESIEKRLAEVRLDVGFDRAVLPLLTPAAPERPMPIFDPGPSARDEDIDWLARSGGG